MASLWGILFGWMAAGPREEGGNTTGRTPGAGARLGRDRLHRHTPQSLPTGQHQGLHWRAYWPATQGTGQEQPVGGVSRREDISRLVALLLSTWGGNAEASVCCLHWQKAILWQKSVDLRFGKSLRIQDGTYAVYGLKVTINAKLEHLCNYNSNVCQSQKII
jgi:hypothetical protein